MTKLMKLSTENQAVLLLSTIAVSSGFAGIHVLLGPVPRVVFSLLAGATALSLIAVIFQLIYAPIRDKRYPSLIANATLVMLFSITAVRLATSGFSEDDEIYSWNFWAIQHFEGYEANFRFTGSPYPQLFSYWIASLYQSMGSVVVQSIPRLFLALPVLIVGLSVISVSQIRTWKSSALAAVVLIFVIGPIAPWYAKGLADPLMTSAVALSARLLISYSNQPKQLGKLALALTFASIAAATKQAGLLWACLSMPIVVILGCMKYKWPKAAIGLLAISIAASMIWPLAIAPHFINNPGVVSASMASRSYVEQLIFSIDEYLVRRPEILFLLVATFFFSWRKPFLRVMTLTAILPALIAWFLFGAYSLRLGSHVLALAGVILLSAIFVSQPTISEDVDIETHGNWTKAKFISSTILAAYFISMILGIQALAPKVGTDLLDGAKSTLMVQFGLKSSDVIEAILANKFRVFATGNYTYGPFYGRVPVGLPDYSKSKYDAQSIKLDLIEFKAEYAIYSGIVPMGPASDLLKELADSCPTVFLPVLVPPNQKGFILYKVDQSSLSKGACD